VSHPAVATRFNISPQSTDPACRGAASQALENGARAALDSYAGRALSDAEWIQERTRLLEFTNILRSWDKKTKKTQPKVDNVEVLCQREP
jgi:hypothetical protein